MKQQMGQAPGRGREGIVITPAMTDRLAQGCIRLLLTAVLAGAVAPEGAAPFAAALTAASGGGFLGGCAAAGACLGYICRLELTQGLRYASVSLLIYAAAFAFYDIKLLRGRWVMPLTAGSVSLFTALVTHSRTEWTGREILLLGVELLLTVGAVFLFRAALGSGERVQRRGRVFLFSAVLCALTGEGGAVLVGLALVMPRALLDWGTRWLCGGERTADPGGTGEVRRRLEKTAGAYRALCRTLKESLRPPDNDGDISLVFDRASSRVCRGCGNQQLCWQKDYGGTFNALNDATARMVERGKALGEDFPPHFSNRCVRLPAFLEAVNEELTALFYRRQYHARVRENREAVCRQYDQLSALLEGAAAELGEVLTPEEELTRTLETYLTQRGRRGEGRVWRDGRGLLRVCLRGTDCAALGSDEGVNRLSRVLGRPLRVREMGEEETTLVEQEPFKAVAGVALRKKDGETVSGDAGTYFKRNDGKVYLLLCDGMGSGEGASRESGLAIRLLEQFLQTGVSADHALLTLTSALALRGEEGGGFTTVDLLELDLFTGEGCLYKLGAAPTYLRQGERVSRLAGESLPAGLAEGTREAVDRFSLALAPGDCVLMVSDGVCGTGEDGWLVERLRDFDGVSPRALAAGLITDSPQGATDDRTALVVKFERRT